MIKLKITNVNTQQSRIASMDGSFEIGKDINGRVCRVAEHSIFTNRLQVGQKIRTSGNIYERIS